jgi:ABC-2 type transport system ATP-binding protein
LTKIAIQLNKLTKTFGRGKNAFHAVNDVTLDIQSGQVYGFLGLNGAGKSTTIRMLLGLTNPTSGTPLVFGKPVHDALEILQKRVGALVEGATLYPFMSGRKNLEVWAHTSQCYDQKRIQFLLELVGMADRADRRANGYSTGMKQRIGIAGALLNNPDLVILDEPTNGLDPQGIQEMRHLIRDLTELEGKTVFLSSHMLHEVEQVCDRVAIVHQGKLILEGAVKDLQKQEAHIQLDVSPIEQAQTLLQERYPTTRKDNLLRVKAERSEIPNMIAWLVSQKVEVFGVAEMRQSLEELFLKVTNTGKEVQNA